MSDPADTRPPHRAGTCEYCGRETTVYAYVLWTCRRCLESDPS
jgi:ribosomal protein S14